MKDKNTKLIISKSPELNAMRNGYPTLREQRILATYLARINPTDPETRTVRFSFEEFATLCRIKSESIRGMNTSNYKNIAKNILEKSVTLHTATNGYDMFILFSRCVVDIDPITGERYLEFSASHEGMKFFFELKKYFTYDLNNVLVLKSLNQIRLYEILKENEWRKNFDIKLDDLRSLLFIAPEEYPLFKKFNQRVLVGCQKAINELTDITFTYTTKRIGRKVGIISFSVTPKIKMSVNSNILSKTKSSPSEKKREIEEAKKSEFWHYALEKSNKNKNNIKSTPEWYAVGIIKNWNQAGYKTISDLIESGEISKQDFNDEPSYNLDEYYEKEREKYRQ